MRSSEWGPTTKQIRESGSPKSQIPLWWIHPSIILAKHCCCLTYWYNCQGEWSEKMWLDIMPNYLILLILMNIRHSIIPRYSLASLSLWENQEWLLEPEKCVGNIVLLTRPAMLARFSQQEESAVSSSDYNVECCKCRGELLTSDISVTL